MLELVCSSPSCVHCLRVSYIVVGIFSGSGRQRLHHLHQICTDLHNAQRSSRYTMIVRTTIVTATTIILTINCVLPSEHSLDVGRCRRLFFCLVI